MAKDWTKIFEQYKGNWVALKSDEQTVISAGKTAKEALSIAYQKGYTTPILAKMPNDLLTYIG